jgi:hypothetical protein
MIDLSERMFLGRIDRPDEWTMDDYARDAKKLESKIAELEKQLSSAQTMGERAQSIRDLEQQAKGVLDAIEYLGWGDIYTDTSPNMNIGREFRFVAGQLTKEAKALKEQSK